jgi:hypothetical protein
VRNGFEIGMKDGSLGIKSFAMTIAVGDRVEATSQLVLSLWGDTSLILDDYNVGFVESLADDCEVIVSEVFNGRTSKVLTAIVLIVRFGE